MTTASSATTAIDRVLAGDVRVAARLMRDIDDRTTAARAALKALHPHTGRATSSASPATPAPASRPSSTR
jgi:putative protein kinase ArgK-like GTPase of G3E family